MLVVVAPLVGAWIEISESIDLTRSRYWSLPSWERGLKFPIKWDIFVDIPVAPLVGAWIEIWNQYRIFYDPNMSLPSWERGLKFALEQVKDKEEPSLPSWERGLKYLH